MFWYPFFMWKMARAPIPRRVFTDLLCDNGDDGTYLRSVMKNERPGLWSAISKQMYCLGYKFDEINELRTNTEFSNSFVTV